MSFAGASKELDCLFPQQLAETRVLRRQIDRSCPNALFESFGESYLWSDICDDINSDSFDRLLSANRFAAGQALLNRATQDVIFADQALSQPGDQTVLNHTRTIRFMTRVVGLRRHTKPLGLDETSPIQSPSSLVVGHRSGRYSRVLQLSHFTHSLKTDEAGRMRAEDGKLRVRSDHALENSQTEIVIPHPFQRSKSRSELTYTSFTVEDLVQNVLTLISKEEDLHETRLSLVRVLEQRIDELTRDRILRGAPIY